MIDLQYHKGENCHIQSTFCQEGYCCDCIIYLNKCTNHKSKQSGSINNNVMQKRLIDHQIVAPRSY
jgi:hypothetical protein